MILNSYIMMLNAMNDSQVIHDDDDDAIISEEQMMMMMPSYVKNR